MLATMDALLSPSFVSAFLPTPLWPLISAPDYVTIGAIVNEHAQLQITQLTVAQGTMMD